MGTKLGEASFIYHIDKFAFSDNPNDKMEHVQKALHFCGDLLETTSILAPGKSRMRGNKKRQKSL